MRVDLREQRALAWYVTKWLLLATPVGVCVGSACALFLWLLDLATATRYEQPWLLFLLPVAGIAISLMYAAFGKSAEAGNNLIVEEIHEPSTGVTWRMAPLVLIGTIVTHLCGGSAGREGTAVQMGGSLASEFARWVSRWLPQRPRRWIAENPYGSTADRRIVVAAGLSPDDMRRMLMAGVAAGFGGVFGTPVAGTIFALEVLVIGRLNYAAFLPCLIASLVSDQTVTAWGVGHTHYAIQSLLPIGSALHLAPIDPWLLTCVAVAGMLFGLTSLLFAELTHGLHWLFRQTIPVAWLRPVCGGLLVIGLVYLLGTRDYIGLGVTSPDEKAVTIVSCFHAGGAHPWSWWWKILFTAITLSSGFKGGEVTPLFFIGAALGNTLAVLCGVPIDLLAAMGFVSVFAGATNTPIACTVMAVELFGGEYIVYFAVSCLMAYLFSGHSGIYLSQRIGVPKLDSVELPDDASLRTARDARPSLKEHWNGSRRRSVDSQHPTDPPAETSPDDSPDKS